MKKWQILTVGGITFGACFLFAFSVVNENHRNKTYLRDIPKGCVYRTIMGEESSDSSFIYKSPLNVFKSIQGGLQWLVSAQHPDGGWGAGTHARQDVMDPHAVPSDPATTSMVAMALLRSGSTLTQGEHSQLIKNALNFLLEAVESSPKSAINITTLTGTQIQIKLGSNIDVILTAQFLSNILDHAKHDPNLQKRIKNDLNTCVSKIQSAQSNDGSISGNGWAGVLQSSFATNALESAQANGANVDEDKLDKARNFQKGNYDTSTGDVKTEAGAGVVLYSVSGSTRASAKEARKVQEEMERAKREGRLSETAPANAESLEKIGFGKDDAIKYSTAYQVYRSAKVKAQDERVMDGFGSNGGEEFLSYLQTGESMIIGKDNDWKTWYDNMSGRLLNIQNEDGSWSGHHCITSPVFCTATCILILSVQNDIDRLTKLGQD